MPVFDASSVIYAWDNYPEAQFPPLWDWLAQEVANGQIVMPIVALDEVRLKAPDCANWLVGKGLVVLPIGQNVANDALAIKQLLGIQNDQYHPNGVGENDIFIIASSKVEALPLVSNEKRQTNLPQVAAKRKIPAVCNMPQVGVHCIDFLEYIKQSGQVFR